jgi:WD40 repeat protein
VKRLYGHTGNVGAMAFNAQGTQLISGAFSGAKSILVWDVASGQVLREIDAGVTIWQLAVAASGDRFFSLDQPALTQADQFIKRWRVDPSVDALLSWAERNREWRTFTCSERARYAIAPLCDEAVEAESAAEAIPTRTPFPAVALQPTRTPLPRTNTPTPTATPTLTATPTPAPYRYQALYAPRWSPDGTRLLAGELSGFVVVWDGATGRELYRLEGHDSFASTNGPRGLWSPDGARIATYSAQNTAQIWDAATGALLHTLRGHNDHIGALRWSPDGSRLATAGDDGTARVWDAATGAPIFVLEGHTAPVFSLAFSPDGDLLATGGEDATARVWDMATGAERWAFGERERILSVLNMNDDPPIITQVVWSADGSRLIAAGTDGAAIVWDVTDGARLFTLRVPGERGLFDTLDYFLGAVFWSPDEAQIILGSLGSAPTVWDVETESLLYALEGHTDLTLVLGWSPDGARLLTAGYDGTLRVWDAATGELALLMDHRATLYSAAWSPDGSRIASVAENGSARLWDAATGDELSFVAQQPAAEATPQITYVLADSRATSAALLQQAAQVMPTFGLELTREARAITATAVQFALAPTQIRDQPDAAGLLFSEDFADNAVDWEIDNGASPDVFARLRDGKYVIDLADQLNWFTVPGSTTPARAPWFTTPFEMTFEVDGIESDQDEVGVFVAFNVQPGMMAWTGIDVHESGYVTLVRNFEVIDEVEGQPFRLHRDRANAVRLRVTPEVYEVYINDARIAAIPADEPISGTIGFGFGSLFAQGDYYAEIDNLTVRPLSGLDDESGPTSTPTPGATPTPTASPT